MTVSLAADSLVLGRIRMLAVTKWGRIYPLAVMYTDCFAYIFLCELDVLGADEFRGTITVFGHHSMILQAGVGIMFGIFSSMH